MKKVFVFVLTLFVFLIQLPGLKADTTNYWDPTKIVSSNVVSYTVNSFEYNDSTLIDGVYLLSVYNTESTDYGYFDLITNVNPSGVTLSSLVTSGDLTVTGTYPNSKINITFEMSDGYFKIINNDDGGINLFIHNSWNVEDWSLTLIEVTESAPTFSQSELTLQIPYDDLMTVQEIQALLSASDLQDGDLTSSIQLVEETYTQWQYGDSLGTNFIYRDVLTPSSTEISTFLYNWFLNDYDSSKLSIYDDGFLFFDHGSIINSQYVFYRILHEQGVTVASFIDGNDFFQYLPYDGYECFDGSNVTFEVIIPNYLKFSVEDSSGNIAYMTVNVEITNENPLVFSHPDFEFDVDYANEYYSYYLNIDVSFPSSAQDFYNYIYDLFESISVDYYGLVWSDVSQSLTHVHSLAEMYGMNDIEMWYELPSTMDDYFIFFDDQCGDNGICAGLYITLDFYDSTIPEITSPYKIIRSDSASLTLDQIKAQLVYSDEFDDNSELVITQVSTTYNPSSTQTGRYLVTYRITDPAGNYSEHTLAVWVVDFTPPVWTVPENVFVNVSINNPLSEEDLPNLLQDMGLVVTVDDYSISVLSGDYFDNSSSPGLYTQSLRLTYDDESYQDLNVQFNVIEENMTLSPEEPSVADPLLVIKQILSISASALLIIIPILFLVLKKHKH